MYAPYPENMMESIKKVEATRAERMATEPRRQRSNPWHHLSHHADLT